VRVRIIAAPLLMVAGLIACQSAVTADDTGHAKPLYGPVKPQVKKFEVTGEVVDAWCFSSKVMGPGRGERHKSCGIACAMGGVTLGIVDDSGQLYIAAKHQGYTGCKELLVPYMAKRVHATGWLAESGGCKLMKIAKVEPAR
jgi:hypothetical protein